MGEVAADNANGEAKNGDTVDEVLYEKIITQLEYYFSDVNLSRDKFMQQQVKTDEGWVPLELLLKFKRLAAILGDRDKSVIVTALHKSSMLEVNEEKDKIRRSGDHPLPEGYEELRKDLMTKTVYVKGFPTEDITFDQIFEYFKQFGPVKSVIMRHFMDRATKNRGFKGSAFVTFPTVEAADAFLKLEEIKYNDSPLIKLWQSDYIDKKRKEHLEDKLSKQQRRRENRKGGKKDKVAKDEEMSTKEGDGGEERSGFPLGAVLHFTGVKEGSTMQRDLIREAVEKLGHGVAFIDFSPGDLTGYLRLDQGNTATQLVDKLKEECDGKLSVGGEQLEFRVVEGEEETNYLDRARKEVNQRRHNSSRNKKRHRGGGRGHFGDRNRKRRGGDMEGGPAAKVASIGGD